VFPSETIIFREMFFAGKTLEFLNLASLSGLSKSIFPDIICPAIRAFEGG
jgi:hypothetical protein